MLVHASAASASSTRSPTFSAWAITHDRRNPPYGWRRQEKVRAGLPAITAALAAHLTGRPAKTVYDRDDDFMLQAP